jgi:hypothetical protein
MRANFLVAAAGVAAVLLSPLFGHPEFQVFIQKNSGRNVDCALCHSHPEGPEGVKPGQIGSLSAAEMDRLNRARAAFEPGMPVDNPLLNEFGNHLLMTVGKRDFLLLRAHPERLADLLGRESDLDGDGIPDSREYLEGTHPLNPRHGDPWSLFLHNLQQSRFELFMVALATLLGLYGLNNLLRWFGSGAVSGRRSLRSDEPGGQDRRAAALQDSKT